MTRKSDKRAGEVVAVRLRPGEKAKVRDAAAAAGLTPSAWLRVTVATALDPPVSNGDQAAADGDRPAIADRDEVLAMLTKAARRGDVVAIKALAREIPSAGAPPAAAQAADPEQPKAKRVDELAARRRRSGTS